MPRAPPPSVCYRTFTKTRTQTRTAVCVSVFKPPMCATIPESIDRSIGGRRRCLTRAIEIGCASASRTHVPLHAGTGGGGATNERGACSHRRKDRPKALSGGSPAMAKGQGVSQVDRMPVRIDSRPTLIDPKHRLHLHNDIAAIRLLVGAIADGRHNNGRRPTRELLLRA